MIFTEGDWGKSPGVVSPYQGEPGERCLVKCRLRKKQKHAVFIGSLCFLVAGLEGSGLLQAGGLSRFMEKGSPRQPCQTEPMGCSSSPETWRGGDRSSAGQHRSLGSNISKVQSLKLDTSIWSNEIVQVEALRAGRWGWHGMLRGQAASLGRAAAPRSPPGCRDARYPAPPGWPWCSP